jgi:hypothetical protein
VSKGESDTAGACVGTIDTAGAGVGTIDTAGACVGTIDTAGACLGAINVEYDHPVRSLLTPRWLLVHAAVVVLVIGFLLLGWWQVTRAAQGNLLSFGYAVEWPVFAGFVIFVWIREMRRFLRPQGERSQGDAGDVPTERAQEPDVRSTPAPARTLARRPRRSEAAYDDSDDPELAAYNHYLAWRNANPHATQADYPGMLDRERPEHMKESR